MITSSSVFNALFLFAPQFATTDSTILAGYLSMFSILQCQVNANQLGCNGPLAFAFLMAHYLTLSFTPQLGMNSGLKEAELDVKFNVDPGMMFLNTTPFGRAYLDLVKRTTIGTTVTNLPVVLGGIQPSFPVGMGCCNGGYGNGIGYSYGNAGY